MLVLYAALFSVSSNSVWSLTRARVC